MERETLTRTRVAELRQIAAELGVSGRWRMKKAMLIEAILEARTTGASHLDERADRDYGDHPTGEVVMAGKDEKDTPTLVPAPEESKVSPIESDLEAAPTAALAAIRAEVEAEAAAAAKTLPDVVEEVEDDPVDFEVEDTDVEPLIDEVPEPPPAEPESVFIDRGPPLPEGYPGRRVRVMVRDPESLFAYWESDEQAEAWEVTAWRGDAVLHSFRTSGHVHNGYLRVPAGTHGRVTLAPVRAGRAAEAVASIAFRTPGVEAPSADAPSRWVHVDEAVFEVRRQAVAARVASTDAPAVPPSLPTATAPGPSQGPGANTDEGFTSQPPGFPYTRGDR